VVYIMMNVVYMSRMNVVYRKGIGLLPYPKDCIQYKQSLRSSGKTCLCNRVPVVLCEDKVEAGIVTTNIQNNNIVHNKNHEAISKYTSCK
jgi:hypothetical protein